MIITRTNVLFFAVCAAAVYLFSSSPTAGLFAPDIDSYPAIKADSFHMGKVDDRWKAPAYEVAAGKGFVIDVSSYSSGFDKDLFYNNWERGYSYPIVLNTIPPQESRSGQVEYSPGKNRYIICPEGGLRSGEKFRIEILQEFREWKHFTVGGVWHANIVVK